MCAPAGPALAVLACHTLQQQLLLTCVVRVWLVAAVPAVLNNRQAILSGKNAYFE